LKKYQDASRTTIQTEVFMDENETYMQVAFAAETECFDATKSICQGGGERIVGGGEGVGGGGEGVGGGGERVGGGGVLRSFC